MNAGVITKEITVDDIEAWFKYGARAVQNLDAVSKSKTAGRGVLPNPKKKSVRSCPVYGRNTDPVEEKQYAITVQEEEERNLLKYGTGGFGAVDREDVESVAGTLDQLELDSTVGGSMGLGEDLMPANLTGVYTSYDFSTKHGSKLPITQYQQEIVDTIESNQVTVVQGSTGSGKTTQVPQYILDHYASQNRYCNILITQPRRIAAISIARRVCNERGWTLGTICGYQIGMDVAASEDTRILYCTTGILREKFIKNLCMHPYTHVILDEIHERDQETDFALLIVRKLLRTNSPHVKVVLMSATLDSQKFARYFSVPVRGQLEPAPVVSVEGRTFSVKEFFLDDLSMLGTVEEPVVDKPEITSKNEDMAVSLIGEFDKLERKEQGHASPVRGTVLIFLPGLREITNMYDKLRSIEVTLNLKIIPLHSTITIEEQYKVFELPERGFRKVILSTNIAESSITVPDIKYVIDFCLTRNLMCDVDTKYTRLQTDWASKSNCLQRKGRAGRVSNGRAYFMITRNFYENFLELHGIPEMQRCPLDSLVLKTKLLNMGDPKSILGLALDPPDLSDIERTILSLKEVFALSTIPGSLQRYDGDLTFMGRVMADLPIDVRMGKLILLGHVFGLLEECLIIAAALSLKSIFAKPFNERLDAYRHRLIWADGAMSDCIAVLNAFRVWQNKKRMGAFRRAGQGEHQWCRMNFIQMRRINEVGELIRELENRLGKFNIHVPCHNPHSTTQTSEQRLLLKLVIAGALYPNYFLSKEISEDAAVKFISGFNPLNTVMVRGLPANQGILYKAQLQKLFASVNTTPVIACEETKAYVQFPWRDFQIDQRVHNGVYLALKMSNLPKPMEISVFSHQDASAMMAEVVKACDSQVPKGRLRSHRFKAVSEADGESMSSTSFKQAQPPNPSVQSRPTIVVTEVAECGHFFGQYVDVDLQNGQARQPTLVTIQRFLNIQHGVLQPLSVLPYLGLVCVAPYQEQTLEYYRGRVDAFQTRSVGPQRVDMAKVYFVDYGNTEWVPCHELKELPSHCSGQPFQAVEFYLCGVRPAAAQCHDGTWSAKANAVFREETTYKIFSVEIYSKVDGAVRVREMKLFDQLPHPSMEELLIKNQLADPAEENLLSKQSHQARMARQQRLQEGASAGASLEDEEEDDGWLEVDVEKVLGSSTRGKPTYRTRLSSPMNPLQMSFHGITFSGSIRMSRVDPESINSIAINDEPQNPFQRMLCAAFVSMNQASTAMILRDTTILPLIPGLPSLVSLLFTPVAEMRTNTSRTCYTGALCGLGFHPTTNEAIMPDNDMEIVFDTEFDTEDLVMINSVRMAINIAVGGNNETCQWTSESMPDIQEKARKCLLNIVSKRRKAVEPTQFWAPHQWNQIPADCLVKHGLQGTRVDHDEAHILNMHSAILLEREPVLSEEESMRQHLEELNIIAQSRSYEPVMCKACEVRCLNSFMLGFHINTRKHLSMVERYSIGS